MLIRAYQRQADCRHRHTHLVGRINILSRTLRAEVDLPNRDSELLPGMYAYANVFIERSGVRALPVAALCTWATRPF